MSNKIRKRVKKIVQHSYTNASKELFAKTQAWAEEWGKRLGGLEERVGKLAVAMSKQIGQMWANMQSIVNSSVAHDNMILAMDKVHLETFGQLSQIDALLQHLTTAEQRAEWLKPDEIKEKAAAWYREVTVSAFEQVKKEQEAKAAAEKEERERLEAEAKAKKEEAAKKPEEKVLEAVQQAEKGVVVQAGGEGQKEYPPGTEVFGGDQPQP